MTVRRLNYTGRKRISREDVAITLHEKAGEVATFDADLAKLSDYKLPEDALHSEAYQHYVVTQMHNAEKDLACALDLAREAGVALPGAALVSQLMARIYLIDDPKRR